MIKGRVTVKRDGWLSWEGREEVRGTEVAKSKGCAAMLEGCAAKLEGFLCGHVSEMNGSLSLRDGRQS